MNSFSKEGFRRKLTSLLMEYANLDEDEDDVILQLTATLLKETVNHGQPRPCCSCGKPLRCLQELGDWSTFQPEDGCEIKIVGAWGSRHDLSTFRGIICDNCVSELSLERERNSF